jgi:S1-C subfamily serine protease
MSLALEELRDRAERAFGRVTITRAWESRRAIVGAHNMPPGDQADLAQQALELLRGGRMPSPAQLAALELSIRMLRPAPLSRAGVLDDLPDEAAAVFSAWPRFREAVKPLLHSIGRIDAVPDRAIGTGFRVSADLLVTNTHVLALLSGGAMTLEKGQAVVRFRHEYGSPDEPAVDVIGVRAVHASLDIALLELGPAGGAARPSLRPDPGPVAAGTAVVAVGYPGNDAARNPLFVGALFGDRFGVKRAAPGEVLGVSARTVYHDCSTLGGNSGSPLLSLDDARVVGVHRDGLYLYRNEAVDGRSLHDFVMPHLGT